MHITMHLDTHSFHTHSFASNKIILHASSMPSKDHGKRTNLCPPCGKSYIITNNHSVYMLGLSIRKDFNVLFAIKQCLPKQLSNPT